VALLPRGRAVEGGVRARLEVRDSNVSGLHEVVGVRGALERALDLEQRKEVCRTPGDTRLPRRICIGQLAAAGECDDFVIIGEGLDESPPHEP